MGLRFLFYVENASIRSFSCLQLIIMSAWRNLQKRNPLKYPKKARAAKFMTIINFEDPWSIASFVPRQNLKYARHRTGKLRIFAHFTYLKSYLYLSYRIVTRVDFWQGYLIPRKTSRSKKSRIPMFRKFCTRDFSRFSNPKNFEIFEIPGNLRFSAFFDLAQNKNFPGFGIPKKSHPEANS